jgi:hypothetical protein
LMSCAHIANRRLSRIIGARSVWIVGGIAVLLLLLFLSGRSSPPAPTTRVPTDPPVSKFWPPTSTQPVPVPPPLPDTGRTLRKSEPSTKGPAEDASTTDLRTPSPTPNQIPPALPPPIEILPPSIKAPVDSATMPGPSPKPHLDLDKIDEAKRVQQRLIDLGFLLGPADGIWGAVSRRALQDFRLAQNIGQGDTWDEVTQQELFAPTAKRSPMPTSARDSFVGSWGVDFAECRQVQGGRGHLTISARRAEAFGTVCEFQSTQREGSNMWRLQAMCANSRERWNANIRLTILGNKLTWSSERGTLNYVRCSG